MTHGRYLSYSSGDRWTTGWSEVVFCAPWGDHRFTVGVWCRIGSSKELALLDTGAEFSVLSNEVANLLSDENLLGEAVGEPITLSTRHGRFRGIPYRTGITLVADEGDGMTIDCTALVLPDWAGPTVLGCRGFLEYFRFGIDLGATAAATPSIYFGRAQAA